MVERIHGKTFVCCLLLAATLATVNGTAAQGEASLIGHWSLDGHANDSAGGNNGSLFGIEKDSESLPTAVPGKFGQALAFDGNASVEIPIDLDYRTQEALTITMWVNLNGSARPAAAQTLVSTGSGDGPNITLSQDQLRARAGGKTVGPRRSLIPDGWNFVAVSWDHKAGQLWMHVNNVEAYYPITYENKRAQGMYFSPRDPDAELHGRKAQKRYLWLGSKDNSGKVYALQDAAIDDVRIYSGLLSPEQLAQLSEGRTDGVIAQSVSAAEAFPGLEAGNLDQYGLGTAIPGDQYDPGSATIPGDQYEPGSATIPGDQYEPGSTTIPGDQYEPGSTTIPGDQYEPGSATIPGDQYEPGSATIPGDQYEPGSATIPGDQYEPGSATIPGDQY